MKKNLDQNSKAKAMWPPVTMKAGLQGRPFFCCFLTNRTWRFLKWHWFFIVMAPWRFIFYQFLVLYIEKISFLKILCYGTYVVGFQTMVIMDLWGMAFHAVVAIALILSLLFISISTYSHLFTVILNTCSRIHLPYLHQGSLGIHKCQRYGYNLNLSMAIGDNLLLAILKKNCPFSEYSIL